MIKTNLPNRIPEQPLWETIRDFSRKRPLLAGLFLVIGLLGIIIPIIPGLLFLFLAVAMFKRGWLSKFRRRFRFWKLDTRSRKKM